MQDEEHQIASGSRRPIQKVRIAARAWTRTRRATFLKVLAETCNVRQATRAAGKSSPPYDVRRRDPAFAQLWDEALAIGYDRLETMLLQRALEGVNAIDLDALLEEEDGDGEAATCAPVPISADDAAAPPALRPGRRGYALPGSGIAPGMARDDIQLALAMLNRRRDGSVRPNKPRKTMSSEEVDALLLQKLDMLARKLKANP